jgi:hypothetical protein
MSSTLKQIREFTTLGEARAFAVGMMDSGHLVDVCQQAVYKTLRRLPGLIVVCFDRFWVRGLPFPNARHLGTHFSGRTHFHGT